MNKVNKKNLIYFFITILVGIVMYWNFVTIHYSPDIYRIINDGYINYAIKNSLTDGRLFMAIIDIVGHLLNIKVEIYKIILTILAVIINSISVMKLKNIILEYKKEKTEYNEIIAYLISFCTIFNFMLVEIMSFLESFIICSAILLIIYAADIFIRKKKYYYIKTVLLCIISVICYQATIPFFIALVVILLIIKNKDNYKRILKDILNSIIIVGVAAFVNILIVNITTAILNTSQMRIGFNIDLLTHNIIYIFKNISWIFINQCNLYFNGLFLFIIIGIIVSILSSERENKRKHVINIFLILFVTIFVNFAMHVPTISAYYTGRTKYAIGSIIGLLFIYMYLRTNIFDNNDWIRKFTTLIIIMYISSNIICAIMQTTYIKQVNKLERKTALQIEQYIREYEEKNSLKINKIGIINIYNQQEKAYYDEINTKSFLAIDAIRCNWSVAGAINFYTNRNLEKVELTTDEKLKYLTCFKDEKSYTCFENMLLVKTYMY